MSQDLRFIIYYQIYLDVIQSHPRQDTRSLYNLYTLLELTLAHLLMNYKRMYVIIFRTDVTVCTASLRRLMGRFNICCAVFGGAPR
jgi:hypothetical protein